MSPAERAAELDGVLWVKADKPRVNRPAPMVAAPAANALFFKNERRLLRT